MSKTATIRAQVESRLKTEVEDILAELGLSPDLVKGKLTPGARRIANVLSTNDWLAVSRLKLSQAQVAELRQFLHGFLIYHLGRIPRGRGAAVAVTLERFTRPVRSSAFRRSGAA